MSTPQIPADSTFAYHRDGRSLSKLESRLRAADTACDQYGRFVLTDSPRAWASTSILGRLIEYGPMGAAQAGRPTIEVPEHIMLVDRCFAVFTEVRQKVFLAVYAFRRSEPREIQMRLARVSRAIFEREKCGILECVNLALMLYARPSTADAVPSQ